MIGPSARSGFYVVGRRSHGVVIPPRMPVTEARLIWRAADAAGRTPETETHHLPPTTYHGERSEQ